MKPVGGGGNPRLGGFRRYRKVAAMLFSFAGAIAFWAGSHSAASAFQRSPVQPMSTLRAGQHFRGRLSFAGTPRAPAIVFFADNGPTFVQACGPAWPRGCTAIQLQAAFARSARVADIPDVTVDAATLEDPALLVALSRKGAEPFLLLEPIGVK